MKVGTAQREITPAPGIDLAGFAMRSQPSSEVLDRLWIRALNLEDGNERLLWLHADLLALDQNFVNQLRFRIERECGIPFSRILISATHTHSGPAAIQLTGCGNISQSYMNWLESQFSDAALAAVGNAEPCQLVAVEGHCELGVDRRRSSSPHTDPRVGALGWRSDSGVFKAVFVCYSMHPVCLRDSLISADWPGETARVLSESLPGRPVVLVSSGACGNINPPQAGVAPHEMQRWGREVAESVLGQLKAASSESVNDSSLKIDFVRVPLARENWGADEVEKYAAGCLAEVTGHREFGGHFERAVEVWRDNMLELLQRGSSPAVDAELGIIHFGPVAIVTVNGEVFSQFAELAGRTTGCRVYVMGCSNGMIGYIAPAEAYAEGGYEVAWSPLFYNLPRLPKGGFEFLARRANELLAAPLHASLVSPLRALR